MITVKRLRELLVNMPDEAVLVVTAPDHEYRCAGVCQLEALTRSECDPWQVGMSAWMYGDVEDKYKLEEEDYRIPILLVE